MKKIFVENVYKHSKHGTSLLGRKANGLATMIKEVEVATLKDVPVEMLARKLQASLQRTDEKTSPGPMGRDGSL